MSGCRRCEIDVTHCHGTLVRHDDESWECSEADCTGDLVVHDFVLACGDVWEGCCGVGPEPSAGHPEGHVAREWLERRAG